MYSDFSDLDHNKPNKSTWRLQLVAAKPFSVSYWWRWRWRWRCSIIFHTWNNGVSAAYFDVS